MSYSLTTLNRETIMNQHDYDKNVDLAVKTRRT